MIRFLQSFRLKITSHYQPLITLYLLILLLGIATISFQLLFEKSIQMEVGGSVSSALLMTYSILIGMGVGARLTVVSKIQRVLTFRNLTLMSGVYSLFGALLLPSLLPYLVTLYLTPSMSDSISTLLTHITAVILVAPGGIFFGAFLPHFMKYSQGKGTRSPSVLYGIFTLGSSLGVYLLIRIFFPLVHLRDILIGTGILFFMCAWIISRINIHSENSAEEESFSDDTLETDLLYIGISSAYVIILELASFRGIITHWGSGSAYSYPFALITYLFSYGFGNFASEIIYTHFGRRLLAVILLGLPASFAVTLFIPKTLPDQGLLPLFFIGGIQHTGVIGFFAGLIFPLLAHGAGNIKRRCAYLSFSSALGTAIGGICFLAICIPLLGVRVTLSIISPIYLALILLVLSKSRVSLPIMLFASVMALIHILIPNSRWDQWLHNGPTRTAQYVEGIGGIAWIEWQQNSTHGPLFINGTAASYIPYTLDHSIVVAIAAGSSVKKSILIQGLGSGGVVRDVLLFPNVELVDVVEWSKELIHLVRSEKVSGIMSKPLRDPRVRVFPIDVRTHIREMKANGTQYSVIIDNLTVIGWAGSSAIRSIEYFASMMPLLASDGMYIILLHHNFDYQRKAAIAGITHVCPYAYSYNIKFIVCSKKEVRWDASFMNTFVDSQLIDRPNHAALFSNKMWFQNNIKLMDKNMYSAIDPIHESQQYFEYEEFAVRKRQ